MGIQPHGVEWKSVMIEVFKLAPDRCHSMDTSNASKRHFIYTCGCREHPLTKTKHNKILRGYGYRCRACSKPLIFKKEVTPVDANVIPKLFVSTADAPLSEAHIRQIEAMIIDHAVLALVADPLMTSDSKLQKLGRILKVAADAVVRHPNPGTLPGGVTHAIIFGDQQIERQQRVAKAFEQRGVIVRKVMAGGA
jgi:SprT protein